LNGTAGIRDQVWGAAFYPTQPRRQTSDPCTNARRAALWRQGDYGL